MPISISGLSSGLDTDAIIEKLVKLEREPIVKLEREKKERSYRIKALQELSKKLETLNGTAKELYGFRAAFRDTKVISGDESVISAKGSKNASIGSREIQVLQLASAHKIATDPIDKEFKIPGGKFTIEVNGESASVKFKGGSVDALKDSIDEKAKSLVNASSMKTQGENFVIVLQSKTMGKKGEIKISGDKEILESIGLVSGEKSADREKVSLVFDQKFFSAYLGETKVEPQNGSLTMGNDGKTMALGGTLWREYILPAETAVKKDTSLEFSMTYKAPADGEKSDIPQRIEFGPDESVSIKGIKLHGYNISRTRTEEKEESKQKFDSVLGVGVVAIDGGKRVEKLYTVDKDAKGKQEIPIGSDFKDKKIARLIFYCNIGTTEFGNAAITTPREGKGGLEPKNVISEASDLKMKVDGIEVIRDRNTELTDVIPGVTITVKKKSESPVSMQIESSNESAIEKIKKFVDAYNEYLDLHRELIKTARSTKPGQPVSNEERGFFIGDMMILRLEGGIKKTISGAYTSRAENPVRTLADMGVSTGKINANWESIKSGKLSIDEPVLKKLINENPDGVTMFFGSDSDGDNKIDGGMAFTMAGVLRPYVISGKNIIVSRIDLENDSIKMANDRILKQEGHIVKYEDRLRTKFGKMEQSMSKSKGQQQWMQNQMGGGKDK